MNSWIGAQTWSNLVKLLDRIWNTALHSQTQMVDIETKVKMELAGHDCHTPSELYVEILSDLPLKLG